MKGNKIKGIGIFFGFIINDNTFTEKHLARIREAAPETEIVVVKDPEDWTDDLARQCADFDVFFGMILHSWIKKLPGVKWAQVASAGVDWILKSPEVAESDAMITNASGVHAIPIGEHIFGLILAFSRNINRHIRDQLNTDWHRRGDVIELAGSTIGLIGLGRIGERTAELAKAFGMKVLGLRRNPDRSSPYVDEMFGPGQLTDMLSQSDWVIVTAAGTEETDGMIGAAEFAAMKNTAYIINIARGSLIQEDEMIKALQEGQIAGAGLDVVEKEPLDKASPLWTMPNVVITPHVAGGTPYYVDRLVDIFCDNLARYQNGEALVNLVDKKLGY